MRGCLNVSIGCITQTVTNLFNKLISSFFSFSCVILANFWTHALYWKLAEPWIINQIPCSVMGSCYVSADHLKLPRMKVLTSLRIAEAQSKNKKIHSSTFFWIDRSLRYTKTTSTLALGSAIEFDNWLGVSPVNIYQPPIALYIETSSLPHVYSRRLSNVSWGERAAVHRLTARSRIIN